MKITLESIIKAKQNFGDFIKTTPLEYSKRLSEKYNCNIYLKREDLQQVRSYKIRGAYNSISSLKNEQKKKGIVCASAGNHAQGVAMSCKNLKIKGTIYMPLTTPEQKVYKTKQFGGKYIEIKLIGDTFDESLNAAKNFGDKNGSIFIHPFDDYKIIEGQATIGLEIFEQLKKDPDYIICPIGGGGVISGIISASKLIKEKTKIIGVEPKGAPSMKKSLELGKNTQLDDVDIFIDGAAVKKVGDKNFKIAKDYNLKVYNVDENRVCSTILEYLKEDGYVIEPAGAMSTDVLKDIKEKIEGKTVVVIISGGNFDFERLPEVKERSMKYEGDKRYYIINFPQRPGALKDFLNCLGENDDIARFEYLKKSNKTNAPVFIGIENNDNQNKDKNWENIEKNMDKLGFTFKNVTNDELYFDLLI